MALANDDEVEQQQQSKKDERVSKCLRICYCTTVTGTNSPIAFINKATADEPRCFPSRVHQQQLQRASQRIYLHV